MITIDKRQCVSFHEIRLEKKEDIKVSYPQLARLAPNDLNSNKEYIYNCFLKDRVYSGSIRFKKYQIKDAKEDLLKSPFPSSLKLENIGVPTVFTYDKAKKGERHFTLNFADENLFSFWKSSLFAQDEMQVLEHPLVGNFREHLLKEKRSVLNLDSNEVALVLNAKRYGEIDSKEIYGNAFQCASRTLLEKTIKRIEKPTRTHLLAIAALRIGEDKYKRPYSLEDISELFFTAFAGFKAAKRNSKNKKTVINTGNWGCGAFGNNPVLIGVIQMLAAKAAKVDQLRYYTVTKESLDDYKRAEKLYQKVLEDIEQEHLTFKEALELVQSLGLTYGQSNGT